MYTRTSCMLTAPPFAVGRHTASCLLSRLAHSQPLCWPVAPSSIAPLAIILPLPRPNPHRHVPRTHNAASRPPTPKVRTDNTYPSGFMDVISIDKTDEHFRLVYDTKGRFVVHRISPEEATYKLCKVCP